MQPSPAETPPPPPLLARLAAVLPDEPALPPSEEPRPALLQKVAALPELESESATAPQAALQALAAAGLLDECVPAAYGGARPELSLRALCTVRAALAYRSPLYDLMFVMQGLGSYAVSRAGRSMPAVLSIAGQNRVWK